MLDELPMVAEIVVAAISLAAVAIAFWVRKELAAEIRAADFLSRDRMDHLS